MCPYVKMTYWKGYTGREEIFRETQISVTEGENTEDVYKYSELEDKCLKEYFSDDFYHHFNDFQWIEKEHGRFERRKKCYKIDLLEQ